MLIFSDLMPAIKIDRLNFNCRFVFFKKACRIRSYVCSCFYVFIRTEDCPLFQFFYFSDIFLHDCISACCTVLVVDFLPDFCAFLADSCAFSVFFLEGETAGSWDMW